MRRQYVLRDYQSFGGPRLGEFGLHVVACLTDNRHFATPAVPLATLQLATTDFQNAAGVCLDGTKADTGRKKALRAALITLLDTQADYVESQSGRNRAIMLTSGFNLTSDTKAAALVPGPSAILSATNEVTTKIRLGLKVADNAWVYHIYVRVGAGAWTQWQSFTDPHDAVVENLVPGTLYEFRVQVQGSKNQLGDFSDPITHMAT